MTLGLALVAGLLPSARAVAEDEMGERPAISAVFFGSLEAGPAKTFASVGVKRALRGGLDESGFRALLAAGLSKEETNRSRPHGVTYKTGSQVMLGYEWRIRDTFVALYGGSDIESEQSGCGCSMTTRTRMGWRLQTDLWSRPTPDIVLHAGAYASTLDGRLWARLAPGWALPQIRELFVGPEVELYRESDYSKLRLGLHLTGLRLLGLTWRLSGGVQNTSDRPAEAYATLGLHWRR
ncbi:hypothetical protein AXW83_09315 [Bosea sp. PAMC 26642]|nr:hypothetical protein AXW83_09315 [Bosea sp. PAMC 26642]